MNELTDKVYNYEFHPQVRKELESLERIASAIIYDGKVDLYEVEILREWIKRNEAYLTEKPLSELKTLFEEINADTVISPADRQTLFHFLDAIACQHTNRGESPDFFDDVTKLEVKNKTFAFVGRLVFGSKYKAEKVVVSNSGNYTEDFSEKVDCLVVGLLEPEAYNRGEYPKALQSALDFKKNGGNILIVRERDFVQNLLG